MGDNMQRPTYDLRYINKNSIYVGDIMLVTSVNPATYEVELAKGNALLLKVSHNLYIDLDFIKKSSDLEYINYCLNNNITDNIILKKGTSNPYTGQLFLKNVRRYETKKEVLDILELKLIKR